MALSTLSGDEQGIILGQLRNALEPRLVMYFSSANKELRALLPPAARQQLRADHEEATALCPAVAAASDPSGLVQVVRPSTWYCTDRQRGTESRRTQSAADARRAISPHARTHVVNMAGHAIVRVGPPSVR